jgi:hypothetical protein
MKFFARFSQLLNRIVPILIVCAAASEIVIPFFKHSLASDGPAALVWIDTFAAQLGSGVLWPRWIPDAYAGLGSPTFYFYPPLAYFCAGPLKLIFSSASTLTIFWISSSAATIASAIAFYALAKRLTPSAKSRWLSALIYGFAPYRIFTLFSRSGLSEHFAFIWPPLILLALLNIFDSKRPRWRDVALCACSIALLLISHLPGSTVFLFAVLIPFAAYHFGEDNRWWAVGSLMIGVLLTSPYLFPIIEFAKYVQLSKLILSHDLPRDALYSFSVIKGGTDFTENAQILIGYFAIFATGILLFAFRNRVEHRRVILCLFWMCAVIVFFQTAAISRPVWILLKFNQTIQFTYRWLLAGILIVAYAFAVLSREGKERWINPVVGFWAVCAIFFAVVQIFGVRVHGANAPWTPYEPAEYASAYASTDKHEVIQFATDHGQDAFIATTDLSQAKDFSFTALHTQITERTFSVSVAAPTKVTLHNWYWPQWIITRQPGNQVIITHPDTTGRATATLPAGNYTLAYTLEASPLQIYSYWIAGAALLLLFGLIIPLRSSKRATSRTTS